RCGLSGIDLAEVAAAGALVTTDQEGGFPVLPAFEDVGAASLFADRVQALAPDQALQLGVLRSHPGPDLDPRRLALDRGLRVAHLQPQQAAIFGCDSHIADATCVTGCSRTGRTPSKASQTAAATAVRTSSTVTGRRSSADNDVTPASLMPHGTMAVNASRSQSQFSENPCSVVARDTRTPTAATLRASRPALAGTHTPERPSTRIVFRPRSPHTLISASSRRRT